jgi:hypothetical protein
MDTYKEKLDRLGVEAKLSASFLAGLVNVEGSGHYLTNKRDTNIVMQSSIHYSVSTVEEKVNLAKDLSNTRTTSSFAARANVTTKSLELKIRNRRAESQKLNNLTLIFVKDDAIGIDSTRGTSVFIL